MANKDSQQIKDLLIIGAGAIGGITAAILHKKGVDIQVLTRKSEHYEAIKKDGLIIEGYEEPFNIPIESDVKKIKAKFKHILIVVKNINTIEVAKKLKPLMNSDTLVYSLQNGFGNTDEIAKYIPKEQIVAGVIGWGATYLGKGKLQITSNTGDFVLGFEDGKNKDDPRLLEMKTFLDNWKPTILTNNIIGYRWSKLIVNSVIASLGGLFGVTVGNMLGDSEIGLVMAALKNEGLQVADKLKIQLEEVDGLNIRNFFYTPKPADNLFTKLKGNLLSTVIVKVGARRHGKIYPSLLRDLQRGLKTEVEYLNGYISKQGQKLELETPLNSFLVKAIQEIEKGKRETGLQNLPEIMEIAIYSKEKIKEQESS